MSPSRDLSSLKGTRSKDEFTTLAHLILCPLLVFSTLLPPFPLLISSSLASPLPPLPSPQVHRAVAEHQTPFPLPTPFSSSPPFLSSLLPLLIPFLFPPLPPPLRAIEPWLKNRSPPPTGGEERRQTPWQRSQLDGRYECVLCFCCTTACLSYWWSQNQFLGPAALINASRGIFDRWVAR